MRYYVAPITVFFLLVAGIISVYSVPALQPLLGSLAGSPETLAVTIASFAVFVLIADWYLFLASRRERR